MLENIDQVADIYEEYIEPAATADDTTASDQSEYDDTYSQDDSYYDESADYDSEYEEEVQLSEEEEEQAQIVENHFDPELLSELHSRVFRTFSDFRGVDPSEIDAQY